MKEAQGHKSKSNSCINCVFLCKLRYKDSSEISKEEREQLKSATSVVIKTIKGFSVADTHFLSCYKAQIPSKRAFGPWKHGELLISAPELDKNKCDFYFPYNGNENLSLAAAERKQAHSIETESIIIAKYDLRISRNGLIISVLAFATSLIVGIIGLWLQYN